MIYTKGRASTPHKDLKWRTLQQELMAFSLLLLLQISASLMFARVLVNPLYICMIESVVTRLW